MSPATAVLHNVGTAKCPFCGFDDPAVTVYADAHVQAFMSLQPINGWHVLVVPRDHYERFADIPVPVMVSITMAAQSVARAMKAAARPDGVTIITEDDYTDAGFNLIPHWKLHVIARYKGDAVKLEWGRKAEEGPSTRAGAAAILRKQLKA
jgi:histidine triad (HIT) family protein